MRTEFMSFEIRPFREDDRAEVVEVWAEAFPDDPDHNRSSDMIDRKLRVQSELFLVAVADGVVVGTVMAGFDGVRGWLHRLAVRASLRRKGLGTLLVRNAEAGLAKLGCLKVNLQVRAPNTTVIAFYRALGYSVEDRISMGRRF